MNKLMILVLLVCSSACATQNVRFPTLVITGFEKEFYSFLRYYKKPITDLSIKFSDMAKPNVGLCSISEGEQPEIYIDRKYWARTDETMHEQLIFHEMGHCILHKQHDDNGVHIMNSSTPDELDYVMYHTQLIEELFHE